jgi:hypothetical protein
VSAWYAHDAIACFASIATSSFIRHCNAVLSVTACD